MTPLIPTEHELHAYIDDRLDPVRRAQVHAWLAANPQEAAQVEAWRNDAGACARPWPDSGRPPPRPTWILGS